MNLLQNNAEQLVIITILLSKIVSNDELATPHAHWYPQNGNTICLGTCLCDKHMMHTYYVLPI